MTGTQHYELAEQLLEAADENDDPTRRAQLLAAAQVHATLAHAAAALWPSDD